MRMTANLHTENMRVTIMRSGDAVWASIHEAGTQHYERAVAVFLSYERLTELAAWEALSAALAAQDVPVKEEV